MQPWLFPVASNGIPLVPHCGSFGKQRKHDIHTGVDLYVTPNTPIYACEDGIIHSVIPFTGKEVNMPWWNSTSAILIRGASGTILYGECLPLLHSGGVVRGQLLGHVIPVLPEHKLRADVQGHSTSMLHVELYSGDFPNWDFWTFRNNPPPGLLDPTPYLCQAVNAPAHRLT